MSTTEKPTRASSSLGEVLSVNQLERLANHKYSASGVSALEPILQPYWRWLVEQIPLWWAPNALTLAGLVINGLTTAILMIYCPDSRQPAPSWCYFLCALGLFIYQTLDAIDGKQARRTNSSSPLGELFDHGCDALSIVFVFIGTCMTVQLGTFPFLYFFTCISTLFLYYMAHWQTFCSGTLQFGFFDVTEAQIGVILAYLLSGIFGPSIWEIQILSTGFETKLIPVAVSVTAGLVKIYDYFGIIFTRGGVGKNGSTVAGTSVLSPSFPIGIWMVVAVWVWLNSPTKILENHPVLFSMTFGMVSSKLSNKLVVSHMSRSEMEIMDSCLVGPLLLLLNQYLRLTDDYVAMWLCFIFCTVDLLRYAINVCTAICNYMNIHCFSIQPVPSKASSSSTTHKNGGDLAHLSSEHSTH